MRLAQVMVGRKGWLWKKRKRTAPLPQSHEREQIHAVMSVE
jgi:hypothetical protein